MNDKSLGLTADLPWFRYSALAQTPPVVRVARFLGLPPNQGHSYAENTSSALFRLGKLVMRVASFKSNQRFTYSPSRHRRRRVDNISDRYTTLWRVRAMIQGNFRVKICPHSKLNTVMAVIRARLLCRCDVRVGKTLDARGIL
jgi:hypothetical protein